MSDGVHIEHRDDFGDKIGMWLFLFTEVLLFGGLFLLYFSYRYDFVKEFHDGGKTLDVLFGAINTVVLLTSSLTAALSIIAIQRGRRMLSLALVVVTILCACVFMGIKYVEWSAKFSHGIYLGSPTLAGKPQGLQLFYGLYYTMTGLHGIHVLVGIGVLSWVAYLIATKRIRSDKYVILENSALYWHIVDLIWIYLFPLFYLVS